MTFSVRLKEERIKKGLTQTELAEKVGVNYTQIGRYENHGSQPGSDVLANLAKALEVSPDYLLNGSQDEQAQDINDQDLITLFKQAVLLSPKKKVLVKEFLEAFLLKNELTEKLTK